MLFCTASAGKACRPQPRREGASGVARVQARPQRERPRARRAAARGGLRQPQLRRGEGPLGRQPRGPAGGRARGHRSQRGRQDEPPELHQRALPAAAGLDKAPQRRGPRADSNPAQPHRHLGSGADLPEHRAVPAHVGAGQPPAWPARPHAPQPPSCARLPGRGETPGDRAPGAGRGGHRLPRAPGRAQAGGRSPPVRPPEARGAGSGAMHAARHPAARRADGGDERRGAQVDGALHPRRQRAGRRHDGPDRARHGRGDGHLEPSDRARLRQRHRRQHPGRGGRRSARHRGLPGRAMTAPNLTFPQLLDRLAGTRGDEVALQEKRYGIWQPITWSGYRRRVRRFAHGLVSLGFERGEVLAILGDNRPEWLISELAAQSLGGISVGLYPDGIVEEVEHVLSHAGVRVVVAEDQEQVDKLLALRGAGRLDTVESIVYYDPHGLEHYDDAALDDYVQLERQVPSGDVRAQRLLCAASAPPAKPKLAVLTHRNLLSMGAGLMEVDPIDRRDEYVSFLPLAWIGEQMISVACSLQAGFALSFPEDASTMQSDLREIGPRVMFSPPRIWESLVSQVQVRLEDAGWPQRAAFRWGVKIGRRAAEGRLRGERPGAALRVAHPVAELVALRPAREQLGLTRLRRAYTGGGPPGAPGFWLFP